MVQMKNPIDDYNCCRFGIATILCKVILEVENVRFLACDTADGCTYLIYPPSYPWGLTKRESYLTEDAVAQILCKYVAIVSDTALNIQYQSVDTYG